MHNAIFQVHTLMHISFLLLTFFSNDLRLSLKCMFCALSLIIFLCSFVRIFVFKRKSIYISVTSAFYFKGAELIGFRYITINLYGDYFVDMSLDGFGLSCQH